MTFAAAADAAGSLTGSISSNIVTGMSSDSLSGEDSSTMLSPFARSRGIALKNSFASLSSVAGSGNGKVPNGYCGALSVNEDDFAPTSPFGLLAPFLAPLFVLEIFVDMDVLQ